MTFSVADGIFRFAFTLELNSSDEDLPLWAMKNKRKIIYCHLQQFNKGCFKDALTKDALTKIEKKRRHEIDPCVAPKETKAIYDVITILTISIILAKLFKYCIRFKI